MSELKSNPTAVPARRGLSARLRSVALAIPQVLFAICPLLSLSLVRSWLERAGAARGLSGKARYLIPALVVAFISTIVLLLGALALTIAGAMTIPDSRDVLLKMAQELKDPTFTEKYKTSIAALQGVSFFLVVLTDLLIRKARETFALDELPIFRSVFRARMAVEDLLMKAIGAVFLLGLALLPLSALLLIVPAVFPQESVLADTVRPARSRLRDFGRRAFYLLTGIGLLIAMLAFSVEVISWLNLKPSYFGKLARMALSDRLVANLPTVMVEQWPYVLLLVYATDVIFLLAIGKVPIQYNLRNLAVRWRTTLLTGLAFTVVVALLTIMLSFLVGLNAMTATSGVPGNVFILSEGSTDELFSNFRDEQATKIIHEYTTVDADGRPLPAPVRVKEIPGPSPTGKVKLCSFETYFVINQEVPAKGSERPRRRLVQLRGVVDSFVARKVHNIELLTGAWFEESKSTYVAGGQQATPAVLGEGAAAKFAEDLGKSKLQIDDQFTLGGLPMVVVGIMKTEGTTFGSEIWASWTLVKDHFRKPNYTTIVLRVSDDSEAGAKALAAHLSRNFTTPRVRAVDELRYYEDLSKSNQQLLSAVIFIVIIMAIGGVFSVMNTMFAAIAQRTKDIGVLRILGFKRWQLLVSFLLETLGIALIGGAIGLLFGSLADGFQMTSNISSGMGSGKTVILRMIVDTNVLTCGMLVTIIMGRIGGLVPALSAMRLGILESLK